MGRKFCRSKTDLNANKGADAVVDCPGSFTTETKGEPMKYVDSTQRRADPGPPARSCRARVNVLGGAATTRARDENRQAGGGFVHFPEKLAFPTAPRKGFALLALRARRSIDRSAEPSCGRSVNS